MTNEPQATRAFPLSKTDRIAALVGGLGVIIYAFAGDHDHTLVAIFFALTGLLFLVGGLNGT